MSTTPDQQPDPPLLKKLMRDDRVAHARDLDGQVSFEFALGTAPDEKHRLLDALDAGDYQVDTDDAVEKVVVTRGDG